MTAVFRRPTEVGDEIVPLHWYGPADANRVLLCVHGWTLDHTSFSGQRALASASLAIASYDRRGFGARDCAPSFDADLNDLVAITQQLSAEVIVFGVSQGARLALRAMTQQPNLFAGAILQGGVVDGVQVPEDARDAIPFAHFKELKEQGLIAELRQEWLHHPLLSTGVTPQQKDALSTVLARWGGDDLVQPGALPSPIDITGKLGSITAPVLLLNGAQETHSRQAHAIYLQRHVKAELVKIEGAGHLVNWTHAAAANIAIAQWIGCHFLVSE